MSAGEGGRAEAASGGRQAAADPGGGRDIRYGIVGFGLMGEEHCRNLLLLRRREGGVRVVGVADADPGSRDRAAAVAGPGVKVVDDVVDLLAATPVDAVVVATPNHTHRHVLDRLWDSGVHVLVEKPLCTTLEDCRWVCRRAHEHRGLVWVGMEYRYMAPVGRLIEEVDAGTVGRPRM
ncbi:MAG: Gfo/Idh/MocA family oxidoreductase, partial [Thermoanaerobaculia bacterium]|nr:Gfo/Idh/MocA family oxidoreductase [Thermoanaerobaculia bacterium]